MYIIYRIHASYVTLLPPFTVACIPRSNAHPKPYDVITGPPRSGLWSYGCAKSVTISELRLIPEAINSFRIDQNTLAV